MPAVISDHQVFAPNDLAEALQFMADHRDESWCPVAGGTEVMRRIYGNRADAKRWINLAPLRDDLAGIHDDGGRIRIGSLTTMSELRQSAVLHNVCPLIRQAATSTGVVQSQNRATVGGRIISASPTGETLSVWLALDAEIELTSLRGKRCVSYEQFMTGRRQTAIATDELLTAVLIPVSKHPSQRMLFRKVASRSAGAIAKVVLAAIAGLDDDGRYRDVRLAFGGMSPIPLRAHAAEQLVEGNRPCESLGERAAIVLTRDLSPVDDHRSTADYRLRAARNLTRAIIAGRIGRAVGLDLS